MGQLRGAIRSTKPLLIRGVSFSVTLFYPWKNSLLVLVLSVMRLAQDRCKYGEYSVSRFPYLMRPDDDMFHGLCCVPVH